ncbi:hypothetical protein EVAR_46781_1 [Eumeta japonica]|uniref:Uncharacterized protein n=1 Tax=Eumeta variegata TaxID=151549 RepID=A0A4C1XDF7_EUMVA|nr:hypothetical protein EVAR_46781_1 [Eumeta japonica]
MRPQWNHCRGPLEKSGLGQCFHCQLYGHAAQNCYAQSVTNAWFRTPARVLKSEPVKEATREPPKPATAKQTATSVGPLREDILTIMSILRVVKSPEFVQLATDFRKARSGEDRLMVFLRHRDLFNRLEKL